VSVCNLSPNVLSRPPCFLTKLSSTRRGHARVHTLKDWCLHICWLTKTCLCVTFNISHRVFHLWPTWNDVQSHDVNLQNLLSMQIFTYETMPENTDLTNTKAVRRVHCKHTYLYETFLTRGDVSVYNVWHASPCLVQFLTQLPIPSPNATHLYKIVSTVKHDNVHVFTKMTHLCTTLNYKDVPVS